MACNTGCLGDFVTTQKEDPIMKSSINTLHNRTAFDQNKLHHAIVRFNHLSTDDKEKPVLKQLIEQQIVGLNAPWELVPQS